MGALARLAARLRRAFRRSRRLRSTREGKYFLVITLLLGLAAINTGNNLLFLLLGWMCSVILASGILSELSLRGLTVVRQPPPRIFSGRPFLMGISLRNEKRRLPSFSIEIEDLVLSGAPPLAKPIDKKCYFLKIPSGRMQSTSYRHTFPRRGRYAFEGFRISTKFPFALFRKSLEVDCPGEVIVFPAIHPVNPPQPSGRVGGEDTQARQGRRGEFFGLRELRDGDDPRDIHWRSSAHKGRLMVREYEEEAQRRATILVENGMADDPPQAERDTLEKAISMAASLASAYISRGYAVRVIGRGPEGHVPSAAGPAQLARILRMLALLPTVSFDVPYAATPDPRAENLLVARRGGAARQRPAGVSRIVEVGP